MKHINLNFTMRKSIKLSRQCLAKGNVSPFLRRNRLLGLLWIVIGGCIAALSVWLSLHDKHNVDRNVAFGIFSDVLRTLPFAALSLYGLIVLINPKICSNYRFHYKKLEETVRRNTGYPEKPYVPEQWEIPLTDYTSEALANILNVVGGWGQDNTFFLCNHVARMTHRRILEQAFIFNMCEKGIYLLPISMDNRVPKVYADLAIVIPAESISKIYAYDSETPQRSSRGFTIFTNRPMWNMFSPTFLNPERTNFRFTARIHADGIPFHDFNVNKVYQMYYVPKSVDTIGYDLNEKKSKA